MNVPRDASRRSTTVVRLAVDRNKPYEHGSVEHYWHYVIGFLLPLVQALRAEPQRAGNTRFLISSCGPVMDTRTADLIDALGLDAEIEPLPRWRPLGPSAPRSALNRLARRVGQLLGPRGPRADRTVPLPRWDVALWRTPDDPLVASALRESAAAFLDLAQDHGCCRDGDMPTGYRLLVRSAPHPFYDPRGGAQNAGYGTGRRSLTGIERCVEVLRREGIDASTYEPGAHDVFCQARTFAAARGIIAIRGAEFANAFWMKPDALLVMVNHEPGGSPPQRGLAKLLGLLHYTEIDAPPSTPLVLDPGTVVPLVQQHLAGLSPKFAF